MKVSVKYSGPGTSAQTWFEGVQRNMINDIKGIIKEATENGETDTKRYIENRGTLKSGKQGRIETGKMRDSVDSEYKDNGKAGATGKFGWINEFERYFGLQEEGFTHTSGVSVEGMYALTDAGNEAESFVVSEIDKVIRRA